MAWQDISTAPKDGSDMLICQLYSDGSFSIGIGHWEMDQWRDWGAPYPYDEATHW